MALRNHYCRTLTDVLMVVYRWKAAAKAAVIQVQAVWLTYSIHRVQNQTVYHVKWLHEVDRERNQHHIIVRFNAPERPRINIFHAARETRRRRMPAAATRVLWYCSLSCLDQEQKRSSDYMSKPMIHRGRITLLADMLLRKPELG